MVDPIQGSSATSLSGKMGPLQEASSSHEASPIPASQTSTSGVVLGSGVTPQTLSDLLNALGLSVTVEGMDALAALLGQNLPATKENLLQLLSLPVDPRIGAFIMSLGVSGSELSVDQLLALASGAVKGSDTVAQIISLLEQVASSGVLSSEVRSEVDSLLSQLRSSFFPADALLSGERLGDTLALIAAMRGDDSGDVLTQMITTQFPLFANDRASLTFLDRLDALIAVLVQGGDQASDLSTGLGKKLDALRREFIGSIAGQWLVRAQVQSVVDSPVSMTLIPFLWQNEPGTLILAFGEAGEREGKASGGSSYASTFLLSLSSLGQIRGRVAVAGKDSDCALAVELEDTKTLIESRKTDLLEAFETAGLNLKRFECSLVPPEEFERFFSPLNLCPATSSESLPPVLRVDLKA